MRMSNLFAAALICVAGAFIAGAMLLAKALGADVLGPPMPALQITWGRFVFALMAVGCVTLMMRPKLARPHFKLHIARTSAGLIGVTLMFSAVAFIPLTDATAISFLNPVFAMMLAIPLLGEKVGPVRWAAAVIALCGALILLRPTSDSFQPAAMLALGAAVVLGAELIVIKQLAHMEKPLQILLVNNIIGVCLASAGMIFVWQTPTAQQWAALAGTGLCMIIAQTCFVNAMARADVSFIAPFSYVTLVFAALYDQLIFGVLPDWISTIGAGVIIAGAVILAWREALAKNHSPPVR